MTVWLIGNRGMLGTEMETLIKEKNLSYFATDREVDITDKESLMAFVQERPEKKIDWIINCSGYTAVDKAEDEPDLAYRINAEGVLNIAQTANSLGASLIHISTDYVFNGEKESGYSEEDEPAPLGVYAKSKLQGEEHIMSSLKRYFILRTAWMYGRHGENFVYSMLKLFEQRNTVKVVSDQWGSPTYAGDLAQIILKIIQAGNAKYGIYHYTNEGKTNWYEFAREIYDLAKSKGLIEKEVQIIPITTEDYPTRAKRPKNSYLSKAKIKKTWGISIRSWQEALQELIDTMRNRI